MKRILMCAIAICMISVAQAQLRMPAGAYASAIALKFPSAGASIVEVNQGQSTSPVPHIEFGFGTTGTVSATTGIVVQEELVAGKFGQWFNEIRQQRFFESRKKNAVTATSGGGNK